MKYLSLLNSFSRLVRRQRAFKTNILTRQKSFFIVFFVFFASSLVGFFFILEKSNYLFSLEKKIMQYEKIAQELQSSHDTASNIVSLEKSLQEICNEDAKDTSAENFDSSLAQVLKKRKETLKLSSATFIKTEKQNPSCGKEIEYRLSTPVEISLKKLITTFDLIESKSASKGLDKFFLKFSLHQQEIAKGYPLFICDFSVLTRVK
jgi:hypothetical protein